MANRTVKDAHTIKGTNPQYLVEKIIRSRIYDCKYWKEECFALTGKMIQILQSLQSGIRNNSAIRIIIYVYLFNFSGAPC